MLTVLAAIFHPLVNIPEKPVINKDAIQTTSSTIFIFWGIPTDVTDSEVTWTPADDSGDSIPGSSGRLPTDTNSFRIQDLKSSTNYIITLTVFNAAGNSSTGLIHSTDKEGE